jgi:hypothetical protein
MIRPGEKLVYSTRWDDTEEDRSDCPPEQLAIRAVVIEHQQYDERHEAFTVSRKMALSVFLRSVIRSHPGAAL